VIDVRRNHTYAIKSDHAPMILKLRLASFLAKKKN
jgi:hypothetical protein